MTRTSVRQQVSHQRLEIYLVEESFVIQSFYEVKETNSADPIAVVQHSWWQSLHIWPVGKHGGHQLTGMEKSNHVKQLRITTHGESFMYEQPEALVYLQDVGKSTCFDITFHLRFHNFVCLCLCLSELRLRNGIPRVKSCWRRHQQLTSSDVLLADCIRSWPEPLKSSGSTTQSLS